MPTLQEVSASINLKVGKPGGLNDLGIPTLEGATIKKGNLQELVQPLTDGKVGRRYQGFKVVGVTTQEGRTARGMLFLDFEIFGDDTAAVSLTDTFEAAIYAGSEKLATLKPGPIYMPFGRFWYANRFAFEVPTAAIEKAERVEFIAKAAEVLAL